MIMIQHRANRANELSRTDHLLGVEIDLRLVNGELTLAHDANMQGDLFSDWLKLYAHKLLVLNVKEDGLEDLILEEIDRVGVSDYFFLDQPMPTLVKSISKGLPVALRVSEYETCVAAASLNPKWLWLDSFTGNWSPLGEAISLAAQLGIKTCLVSPELQGRDPAREIPIIIGELFGALPSAVCTKYSEMWNLE